MNVLDDTKKVLAVIRYLKSSSVRYRIERYHDYINYTIAIPEITLDILPYDLQNELEHILNYRKGIDKYFYYDEDEMTWYIVISPSVFIDLKTEKEVKK